MVVDRSRSCEYSVNSSTMDLLRADSRGCSGETSILRFCGRLLLPETDRCWRPSTNIGILAIMAGSLFGIVGVVAWMAIVALSGSTGFRSCPGEFTELPATNRATSRFRNTNWRRGRVALALLVGSSTIHLGWADKVPVLVSGWSPS